MSAERSRGKTPWPNPLLRLIRGEITTEQYVASVKERVAENLRRERERKAKRGL